MYSGPAKSTPVYEKGGCSLTRNVGRGGGWGFWYGLLSNLRQSTQLWIIDLTKLLPFTLQNLDMISVSVLHTIVHDSLVYIPDNQRGQKTVLVQIYGVFRPIWDTWISQSPATSPNSVLVQEQTELLLPGVKLLVLHQFGLGVNDPQSLSLSYLVWV